METIQYIVIPTMKMIQYTDSTKGIVPEMLDGFFEGWTKPLSNGSHLSIFKNSDHIVLAVDTEVNRVVGFVTAITDNVLSAFIPLFEVLPSYREKGIGINLMTKMLEKLKDIPGINLTCDSEMQRFYSKFDMIPSAGMIIRKY